MKARASLNQNNLDCLRLLLASIVALFHVSALTNLDAFSPLGTYLSPHFAVKSFFVISGLLIYRSYTRSSSAGSYYEKRIRRIYPAYFTVIVLSAVALSCLSSLPLARYFVSAGFWKYLGANLLFLNFLAPSLPGVFSSNAMNSVNGALWTLKIEVAFYIFVPCMHYLCTRFGTKRVVAAVFLLSCAWRYGFGILAAWKESSLSYAGQGTRNIYSELQVQFPSQLTYFTIGILLLLYFDKLQPNIVKVALVSLCLFLMDHWFMKGYLDVLWIAGFVFVFGFWRYFGNFAKYGDISYGTYIVHWPVLQAMIACGLAARFSPALFLSAAMILIFLAAFLLWTFVESRFLASSSHYRQVRVAKA